MWDSFKNGLKIGFNCFLASYTCLFFFFVIGTINLLNLYVRGFSFLDILSLAMCIYNTYWLSSLIQIRKSFRKSTFEVLSKDTETKKSDKSFVADLIYSIFWKDVYTKNFQNEEDQDKFIKAIVVQSIDKYNEGTL
jgi:hypothetical protein